MTWRRAGLAVISMVALVAAAVAEARPAAAAPSIAANSYVVIDSATGDILASQDMHKPMLAASTVKLMTALTALDLIPADAKVTVSPNAASRPAMRIGMTAGQQWTLRDAIRSLIMVSANDAAYALAEQASGSVPAFAQAMAQKAQLLGLKDSTLLDPAGLDGADSLVGASLMSTYDLAIVARAALANPEISAAAAATTYQFTGPDGVKHKLINHNKLLPGQGAAYTGAIGLKTGFTSKAKQCMVAAATRDGRTVIAVMLGGSTLYEPINALLDFGFATPVTSASFEKLPSATGSSLRTAAPTTVVAPNGEEAGAAAPVAAVSTSVAHTKTESASSGGFPIARVLLLLLVAAFLVLWFRPKARRSRARLRRQRRRARLAVVEGEAERIHPTFAIRSSEVN